MQDCSSVVGLLDISLSEHSAFQGVGNLRTCCKNVWVFKHIFPVRAGLIQYQNLYGSFLNGVPHLIGQSCLKDASVMPLQYLQILHMLPPSNCSFIVCTKECQASISRVELNIYIDWLWPERGGGGPVASPPYATGLSYHVQTYFKAVEMVSLFLPILKHCRNLLRLYCVVSLQHSYKT